MKFKHVWGATCILLVILFASGAGSAQAQTESYANLAREAWVSFECAVLASIADNEAESSRLFQHGYAVGKRALTALQENKVTKNDAAKFPVGIGWVLLPFPSPEFVLGRVYSAAEEDATRHLYVDIGGTSIPEDKRKAEAKLRYGQKNCVHIGRAK